MASQTHSGHTALIQMTTGPDMTLYPNLGSQAYLPTSPIPPLVGPPNMGNLQYQPGWVQPTGYRYPQYPIPATPSYPLGNYGLHVSAYPIPRVSPQGFHPPQRYQPLYIPPVPLTQNLTPIVIHPDPELTTFSPWEVSSVSATMVTICLNNTYETQLDPISMEILAEVTPPQSEMVEPSAETLRTPGTPAVGSEREELTTPPSGTSSDSPSSFYTGVPPDWEAPKLKPEPAPPSEVQPTPCPGMMLPQGFFAQVSQANAQAIAQVKKFFRDHTMSPDDDSHPPETMDVTQGEQTIIVPCTTGPTISPYDSGVEELDEAAMARVPILQPQSMSNRQALPIPITQPSRPPSWPNPERDTIEDEEDYSSLIVLNEGGDDDGLPAAKASKEMWWNNDLEECLTSRLLADNVWLRFACLSDNVDPQLKTKFRGTQNPLHVASF